MLPSNPSVYPEFVADQILTAHDLNESFNYLDEQERLTRIKLLGMGIVCGLQIKTNTAGTEITISKGVGVTSYGYLISMDTKKYTKAVLYPNHLKDKLYDRFANEGPPRTKKFDLWELKEASVDPNAFDLTLDFLNKPGEEKIVLLYIELLQVGNKNCDPNSCDDKGKHYEVTIRPLLVSKSAAADMPVYSKGTSTSPVSLPGIKIPRFDVPSGPLLDSEDLFEEYFEILDENFIKGISQNLIDTYQKLMPVLQESSTADPAIVSVFQSLPADLKFLYDGSIVQFPERLLNTQYYYDFISDLIAAYNELRKKSIESVCECSPDPELFPLHLMLGEAIGSNEYTSVYRQRFISSPILCCCSDDQRIVKILFERLLQMIKNFSIPDIGDDTFRKKSKIGITPSILGKEYLSEKAIPFYYKVKEPPKPLFETWSAEKTREGNADKNLSYHAKKYNTVDEYVYDPLKYDLEDFNFLRVEGHIGRNYDDVLKEVEALRKKNRLPFDIIALSSNTASIFDLLMALDDLDKGELKKAFEVIKKHPCCFSDIFLLFDDWIARFFCCLLDQMRYYLALPSLADTEPALKTNKLSNRLFLKTNADFNLESNTVGHIYYNRLESKKIDSDTIFAEIAAGKAKPSASLATMANKLDRLADVIPDNIIDLNMTEFESRYKDLTGTAANMNTFITSANAGNLEGINKETLAARLKLNCIICLYFELLLLVKEFLLRLLRMMLRHKLGFYAVINPGIQHKAGVTMGGTFIIVYHEEPGIEINKDRLLKLIEKFKTNSSAGLASKQLNTASQPVYTTLLMEEEWLFLESVLKAGSNKENKLDEATSKIKEGVVIADFYLPYLCCSDCPPVNYIFPKPVEREPLKVDGSEPVCSEDGKNFTVLLTVSGGIPPYKVDGETKASPVSITTESGQGKKVVVEDAEGNTKEFTIEVHTCTLPLDKKIGDAVCNAEGTKFTVQVTAMGGTPPYKLDGAPFTNGNSTDVEVQSGLSKRVTISDSAARQLEVDIEAHTCPPPPCNLPCEGLSEKCEFILWFQKPAGDHIVKHKTVKASLSLVDENGQDAKIKDIDVLKAFNSTVDTTIKTANYDDVFKKLANALSKLVPAKFLGNNQPMFTYDDQNQLLTIERFVCHKIVLQAQIDILFDDKKARVEIIYTNDFVSIISPIGEVKVPKMGCIRIDKCKNSSEPICKKQLVIDSIEARREHAAPPSFTFRAKPRFDNYYWYFYAGKPMFSGVEEPTKIEITPAPTTLVRLIGINNDGCFAILEKEVPIG